MRAFFLAVLLSSTAAFAATPIGHVRTTSKTVLFAKPDESIVWYDAKTKTEADALDAQEKKNLEAMRKQARAEGDDVIELGGKSVVRPKGTSLAPGKTLPLLEIKEYSHEENGTRFLLSVDVDGKAGWVDVNDVELLDVPGELGFNVFYVSHLPPEWVCEQKSILESGEVAEHYVAMVKPESEWTARARLGGAYAFWTAATMYKDVTTPAAQALFKRAQDLLGGVDAAKFRRQEDKDDLVRTRAGLSSHSRSDYVEQCKEQWIGSEPAKK